MRKTIVTGILAAALITAGGTGMYMTSASANENSGNLMQNQGIDMEQMHDMMNSENFEEMQEFMENGNVNFGQMKRFMKEMHPELSELSNKELLELYKGMHGTAGSANSHNFKGMMGN
ncbi:hypothetical protein [Paenisporosarcina sp. TG-14]|uniref:hypothetical protein n=1 Tax=Paenisporosarcina sp. TG-14 TaxID=1231057 RepID=UPI00031563D6|nr:hypothetical protein [Paenisporosarcina sp. TG-14]